MRITSPEKNAIKEYGIRFKKGYRASEAWINLMPKKVYHCMPSFDRKGLDTLVTSATQRCTEETGIQFPYNLTLAAPWAHLSYGKILTSEEERDYYVSIAARVAGWLNSLTENKGEYPLVIRLLTRSQSERGIGSPRTTLNLFKVVEKFSSPGKLNRWLRNVIRRSDDLLRKHQLYTSWKCIGRTITLYSIHPTRAAVRAAMMTLVYRYTLCHSLYTGKYREMRVNLVQLNGLQLVVNNEEENYLKATWAYNNRNKYGSVTNAFAASSDVIKSMIPAKQEYRSFSEGKINLGNRVLEQITDTVWRVWTVDRVSIEENKVYLIKVGPNRYTVHYGIFDEKNAKHHLAIYTAMARVKRAIARVKRGGVVSVVDTIRAEATTPEGCRITMDMSIDNGDDAEYEVHKYMLRRLCGRDHPLYVE